MAFKDNLEKFFNSVNENTTGWQDWLSGNTEGYKGFSKGVASFNDDIDNTISEVKNNMKVPISFMSTAAEWTSKILDFVQMDDEIIDKYNKSKSNPTGEAIAKSVNQNIVDNLEDSLIPLTKPYKTILDKFAPEVASGVFNKGNKKEILRSLATREQDFIGNIYYVFLYIEDKNGGIKDNNMKGLSVRTKNLTIPTRQAETFKIDFMNRSIPKIDTSLNLNNTIDLTFTLDDEFIIFKELTNHGGITYMPISSTKKNFYDTVEFLQESGTDKSELTSGFALENSKLVLDIWTFPPSSNSEHIDSVLDKLSSSTNKNLKKLANGYYYMNQFTYKNLKIKSLGEINFDKNQAGPMTVSLSALFNPKTV